MLRHTSANAVSNPVSTVKSNTHSVQNQIKQQNIPQLYNSQKVFQIHAETFVCIVVEPDPLSGSQILKYIAQQVDY
jgi:hypothetical protein